MIVNLRNIIQGGGGGGSLGKCLLIVKKLFSESCINILDCDIKVRYIHKCKAETKPTNGSQTDDRNHD
jgi:hypothetical protein